MASKPYGSATIADEGNKRDGRTYQEPIGASTQEPVGDNELLNGCIGTAVKMVVDGGYQGSEIGLGTKGIGMDANGDEVVGYYVQAADAAPAGTLGLIAVDTWIWTSGGGADAIMADVLVGDRAWAGEFTG